MDLINIYSKNKNRINAFLNKYFEAYFIKKVYIPIDNNRYFEDVTIIKYIEEDLEKAIKRTLKLDDNCVIKTNNVTKINILDVALNSDIDILLFIVDEYIKFINENEYLINLSNNNDNKIKKSDEIALLNNVNMYGIYIFSFEKNIMLDNCKISYDSGMIIRYFNYNDLLKFNKFRKNLTFIELIENIIEVEIFNPANETIIYGIKIFSDNILLPDIIKKNEYLKIKFNKYKGYFNGNYIYKNFQLPKDTFSYFFMTDILKSIPIHFLYKKIEYFIDKNKFLNIKIRREDNE